MIQVQFSQILKRKAAVSGKLYGVARKPAAIHQDNRLPRQRQVAFVEQFKFLISAEVAGEVDESDCFCHHQIRITDGCAHE